MTVLAYTERLLAHLGIESSEVAIDDAEDMLQIHISVDESEGGILIGHHGDVLASIQRVIRIIFQDELDKKIVVNINDYRERRQEKLQEMARNVAQRVIDTGKPYTFSYLPANERYVIHSTLSEDPTLSQVMSYSEGEGADRRLVVAYKDE